MSAKKSMFIIWAVASILWLAFSFYMFRIDNVAHVYSMNDRYEQKVLRGRSADPLRYEYNRRAYERSTRETRKVNRDLGLFFLVGMGLPGLMLAIGTMALENTGKPASARKKS
jgi:hypothetical protein